MPTACALLPDRTPSDWQTVRELLAGADPTYFWTTLSPDGAPVVRPVLGVWVDDALHVAAGPSTRKARNLASDQRCAVAVEHGPLDLVLQGHATVVRDEGVLRRVADAYRDAYGWEIGVADGRLTGSEGAPTAGPPPYDVHRIVPATAFGFGTEGSFTDTRWRF